MSYQVCDPSDSDNWHDVDGATNARSAALQFLVDHDYDERDFDPLRPIELHVRSDRDRSPVMVRVRVVPAHLEVL